MLACIPFPISNSFSILWTRVSGAIPVTRLFLRGVFCVSRFHLMTKAAADAANRHCLLDRMRNTSGAAPPLLPAPHEVLPPRCTHPVAHTPSSRSLSENALRDDLVDAMSPFLARATSITSLRLAGNGFRTAGLATLFARLPPSLLSISLAGNNVGFMGAQAIGVRGHAHTHTLTPGTQTLMQF